MKGHLKINLARFPFGITGNVTSGYQDVEGDKTTPAGYDYWHYSVGASKDIGGLTATLAWHDVGTENYCSSSANCDCILDIFS